MAAESRTPGVVVTRGEGPDGPLTQILVRRGARVLHWGSIAFAPPEDPAPLLGALAGLGEFDWIYFSSPRAVEAVVGRLPAPPAGVKIAAVGPSTAGDLRAAGWPVNRTPEEPSGKGMVEAFRNAGDASGTRVFFPASAIAGEAVPRGLESLGATVHRVTAYRTVKLPLNAVQCRIALEKGEVRAVTFASPSAMEGLREGLGDELFRQLAADVPAAAMGPTTAGALKAGGWRRIRVAVDATLEGLAEAALEAGRKN